MQVKDLLKVIEQDLYVSIEDGKCLDPLRLGTAKSLQSKMNYNNDSLLSAEVEKCYPEYYKGIFQMGITIIIKK